MGSVTVDSTDRTFLSTVSARGGSAPDNVEADAGSAPSPIAIIEGSGSACVFPSDEVIFATEDADAELSSDSAAAAVALAVRASAVTDVARAAVSPSRRVKFAQPETSAEASSSKSESGRHSAARSEMALASEGEELSSLSNDSPVSSMMSGLELDVDAAVGPARDESREDR